MTQDLAIMQPLVDKLCNSLITEPENWDFGVWDITAPKHLGKIKIYIGLQSTFTQTWSSKDSTHTETVFSYEQGRLIEKAYRQALSITGSRKQQELLKVMQPKEEITISPELKPNISVTYKIIILLSILTAVLILIGGIL